MLGKFFNKPEAEQSDRVPPGQYLAKGFPVLTYGETPEISTDQWQLKVWGLATAKTFSWADIMRKISGAWKPPTYSRWMTENVWRDGKCLARREMFGETGNVWR